MKTYVQALFITSMLLVGHQTVAAQQTSSVKELLSSALDKLNQVSPLPQQPAQQSWFSSIFGSTSTPSNLQIVQREIKNAIAQQSNDSIGQDLKKMLGAQLNCIKDLKTPSKALAEYLRTNIDTLKHIAKNGPQNESEKALAEIFGKLIKLPQEQYQKCINTALNQSKTVQDIFSDEGIKKVLLNPDDVEKLRKTFAPTWMDTISHFSKEKMNAISSFAQENPDKMAIGAGITAASLIYLALTKMGIENKKAKALVASLAGLGVGTEISHSSVSNGTHYVVGNIKNLVQAIKDSHISIDMIKEKGLSAFNTTTTAISSFVQENPGKIGIGAGITAAGLMYVALTKMGIENKKAKALISSITGLGSAGAATETLMPVLSSVGTGLYNFGSGAVNTISSIGSSLYNFGAGTYSALGTGLSYGKDLISHSADMVYQHPIAATALVSVLTTAYLASKYYQSKAQNPVINIKVNN